MRCMKCGQKTGITESRDEHSIRGNWLMARGMKVFGWYSPDFRCRRRRCRECDHEFTTIELDVDELQQAFEELRIENGDI